LTPIRRIYLLPAVRSSDPDKSPPCSQTNTSSQLSPTRSSGVGGAATRAADVGSRPTRPTRWRSKDEPTAAVSAIRLTASALPAGVSFAGQARRPANTLRSRLGTSPLSAVSGVPQLPQKRLSCGFSWRHFGQKARWVKIASFPLRSRYRVLYPPALGALTLGDHHSYASRSVPAPPGKVLSLNPRSRLMRSELA
jgi:hypothetical protein